MIIVNSVHNDKEFLKKYEIQDPNPKNVRFDIKYMACELIPINKNKFRFKMISNIDPNVNWLPNWAINFLVRKIGSIML